MVSVGGMAADRLVETVDIIFVYFLFLALGR